MRAPGPFDLVSLDLLRPGPPLRRTQHDHGPARTDGRVRRARRLLLRTNLADRPLQRVGHLLMHDSRIASFDEIRRVTVADEQCFELLVADARQDRWIGDLVAVEIEDGQHRTIAGGIEEFVRVPRGRERPGLGFAVTHDAGDNQIGIVERHAVGVRETVAKLAAFVDGAWCFWRDVAADVAGEGELLEELLHPFRVLALVGINLGVRPLEIRRPQHARCAVARSGDENHVEVVLDDHSVQVHPHERQRRAGAPMAEEPVLDVLCLQRLFQQGVVLQVDHPHRQVVACPPEGVHQFKLVFRQRRFNSGDCFRFFR